MFTDGCPDGESPAQVATRVDPQLSSVRAEQGVVLCCLPTATCCGCWQVRWLELTTSEGRRFLLDTATLKRLSHYEGVPALGCWNAHTPG